MHFDLIIIHTLVCLTEDLCYDAGVFLSLTTLICCYNLFSFHYFFSFRCLFLLYSPL